MDTLFSFSFHFLSFFFFFWLLQGIELLGQGSDLSHSCHPSQSWSNPRPLTHCAGPGIELAPQCSEDTNDLVAPQKELQDVYIFKQAASPCVLIFHPCRKCPLPCMLLYRVKELQPLLEIQFKTASYNLSI